MRQFDRFQVFLRWGVCVVAFSVAPFASAQSSPAEELKLVTKDGVRLGATYYASSMGKKAVPIVMLHEFKENRAVFHTLARTLQNPSKPKQDSHAVLTVDLRGHGESTTGEDPRSGTFEIEAARLRKQDFRDMVLFDMEAVRKFLVTKNDAGELNLNKLCLMGSGLGANVAISYAAYDWDIEPLPRLKQGQDVKMLFLSSPSWNSHGLTLVKPLRQPGVQSEVSVFVVYGERNARARKDAKAIQKNLEKFHPQPRRGEIPELIFWPLPTELQGTRLLVDPQFQMLPHINRFVRARLTEQDYDWLPRRIR